MTAVQMPLDVLAHSRFFDHLVDLIPAKFYYTEEEPAPNLKYMKKDARYLFHCLMNSFPGNNIHSAACLS